MKQQPENHSTLPRVDFYLLTGQSHQAIHQFCCRLVEKAWKLGNTVFIRTRDEAEARLLDDLMWTYSDGSFLPHALENNTEAETPVIIGNHSEPASSHDLLINLADDLPTQNHLYQRIAEVVNEDAGIKQRGRQHYAHYDTNNYPLHHHNIHV